MTQKTRNELKDLFKTGAKPSGDDFKAFIDSTLNVSDDGIAKAAGADTPLKINAQGTDEKLLDFYTGETKTWSINQKPADDKSGLNIATPGGSKLFIASDTGNVGIGTTSPDAKLEISGDLKLQSGVAVNEFSTDGTLAGNSDLAIPTQKAVKTYADTRASLAGSSSQNFAANNLTLSNNLKLKLGATVNKFSTDGTLAGNSDLAIPTEKAVKTYVENIVVTGMIVMWSGASTAIPTGWALCDGVGGRPDLQDRFIMGAGANNNKTSGNATTHSHGINVNKTGLSTENGGSHYHNFPTGIYRRPGVGSSGETALTTRVSNYEGTRMTANGGAHNHQINLNFSMNSGMNSGEIKPKWYALCFIIRL